MPKSKQLTLLLSSFIVATTGLLLSGCQNTQQMLAQEEGVALQTALRRGQFELGCPAATGSVLSNNMLQPVLWGGRERAEYSVGVEGCGKRATYIVVCQLGSDGCVAAAGQDNQTIN